MSELMSVVPLDSNTAAVLLIVSPCFSTSKLSVANPTHASSFDHLRPQDILDLEFPGVLEEGSAALALRLPLRDLAPVTVLPALRFKCVGGEEPDIVRSVVHRQGCHHFTVFVI
jgi:hypothetical protein